MEPLGRKADSSFRKALSCRHSYRRRSHKKKHQPEITTLTKQKVTKTLCVCVGRGFCVYIQMCLCLQINFFFPLINPLPHQSTMSELLSGCEHALVSTSLTVATLPLLVLAHGRSQSLTNEIPQEPWGKDRLSNHRSDSFDSLPFGRLSSVSPMLSSGVPRIIVISPTSESSIIKHDSACLEESMEVLEDSVFASLNFSSEVFQAVELLS